MEVERRGDWAELEREGKGVAVTSTSKEAVADHRTHRHKCRKGSGGNTHRSAAKHE